MARDTGLPFYQRDYEFFSVTVSLLTVLFETAIVLVFNNFADDRDETICILLNK